MAAAPDATSQQPHDTRLVVWDVPSSVEPGEQFSIKLGVKCSAECVPDAWTVEVRDQGGTRQATVTVGGEAWPGTDALYHVEIDLPAPDTEGLHAWEARAVMDRLDVPHTDCFATFGVRVVPTPECLLTVVAIDMESELPVEGAKVVVHPLEAFTDQRGVAKLRLPRGDFRLLVSGRSYFPLRVDGEMTDDATIRAELALDRELTDADIWY